MRKLIIGITGTFGSGKTTVARMLKKRGAFVIDVDRLAKRIANTMETRQRIIHAFGTAARKKLAKIVFSDTKKLKKLNAIIHPQLKREIRKIIAKSRGKIIIIDAALLIEARFLDLVNYLILVTCNDKTRRRRLLKKGFDKQEITARSRFQLSATQKRKHADFIIDNSKTKRETERQVEKLWKTITSRG